MSNYKKLHISDNAFLAYNKFVIEGQKSKTGVVFLSGYMSDMEGSKAVYLENLCKQMNVPFVRFDYSGCGSSSGDFMHGTITKWKEDSLRIIDSFTEVDEIILVGSSMGGWLMLLIAMERSDRISGLIGVASAPDFTEDLMWEALSEEAQKNIMEKGSFKMPTDYCDDPNDAEQNHYLITKDLILDGRKNSLLESGLPINIDKRIILIHGIKDEDVPYKYSLILKEKLSSKNVEVILQKEGKHRMSEPEDLDLIKQSLLRLL